MKEVFSNFMNKSDKKKRLVYQVSIGSSKLYDFCIESVSNYCKRCNIEHRVQREQILCICPDPKTTNRSHAAWNKPGLKPGLIIFEKENAFDLLGEYDQIAIIDSDIYIRESAPNIFDDLTSEYAFGAVFEREMPITEQYRKKILAYSRGQYGNLKDVDWKWHPSTGAEFANMGVMVLNSTFKEFLNGQTAKEFLMRKEFKKFIDGDGNLKWSTDQSLINYSLKKYNVPTKHLDWRWNALYRGIEDKHLKDAQFIHFFLKDHLPNKGEDVAMLKKIIDKS